MDDVKELLWFAWKEALCCIFPVIIFLTLALSKLIEIPYLPRYDFILLICMLVQLWMVWTGLESLNELKVITLFHLLGLGLELYKVSMGSWSYPEEGWTKIAGVPLYSGFMYASVASYVCQAWKRFDLQLIKWPQTYSAMFLVIFIYLNFFTHHFMYDVRWILIAGVFLLFRKSKVLFTVTKKRYEMSAIVSFILIAIFIWFAENISTFFGAWKYPNQNDVWRIVHWGKISSWFLLVIISIIIIAQLKKVLYGQKMEEHHVNQSIR
ncbi:DUF817 domain-containing protein [Paenibacillus sp. N3.4]|uniref:DUF817 domain-containing protein n=1 Tax=Paenibacillus sp. N3.4 TaxID=2603222 RepID=UPI0021C2B694|nr:DUF817 domain-containing protein [Paenibacillus sp. N3.4]